MRFNGKTHVKSKGRSMEICGIVLENMGGQHGVAGDGGFSLIFAMRPANASNQYFLRKPSQLRSS